MRRWSRPPPPPPPSPPSPSPPPPPPPTAAPGGARATEAEIAVCPAQRSGMVYALVEEGRRMLLPRLVQTARGADGVELVLWRTSDSEAAIARGEAELRFAPDGAVADARGATWSVEGDVAAVLGATAQD